MASLAPTEIFRLPSSASSPALRLTPAKPAPVEARTEARPAARSETRKAAARAGQSERSADDKVARLPVAKPASPPLAPVEPPMEMGARTRLLKSLEAKVKRILNTEKTRDSELAHLRAQVAQASEELVKEVERLKAGERRVAQKHEKLEGLLSTAQALEEDFNATRCARQAIESLHAYYESKKTKG